MNRVAQIMLHSSVLWLIFASFVVANFDAKAFTLPSDCAKIENDVSRLACYDSFFEIKKEGQKQVQKTEVQKEISQDLLVAPETSEIASIAPAAPANKPTDTVRASQTDDFGAQDLERKSKQAELNKKLNKELNKIESTVTDVKESKRGIRTFTLANGQMWRETQNNRLRVKEGTKIYIEKGALSAHFLGKEGVKRRTKVNRVK